MATTKIPVWIRSEYVTIVSPPFIRSGGQEAPLIWSGELTACRLSVAPRIENTTGFGKIQGLAARGWGGICSVAAAHQAEPGRTSRPVPGLFFGLAARAREFQRLSPAHQAEPGRTSRPVPGLFFCLAARAREFQQLFPRSPG